MHHQINKKRITLYFFLFLIFGTINNKNFELFKINDIKISGLDETYNLKLYENLKFLKIQNLFFLDKKEIDYVFNSIDLIENYSIFKKYPSSLDVRIKQTLPLAYVRQEDKFFFLGTNGKLIEINPNEKTKNPFIFGRFSKKEFFRLKKALELTNFKYDQIKNLFFFPSGRWDIETFSGVIIKLPYNRLSESLKLSNDILLDKKFQNIKIIDLRQKNQVIINE